MYFTLKFRLLNTIFFIFFLFIFNLKYSEAWYKSDFHIDSKLPRECGHSKQFSPENYFEYWGFWPWLGRAFYNGTGNYRCNVVLIHPQVVITSLECVKYIPEVKLEETLFVAFSLPGLPSFQNISVTHINFTGSSYNTGKSMAILRLSKAVIISSQVQPICLWEEDHNYIAQLKSHFGIVVGTDLENLYTVNELRVYQAPVRLIDPATCRKKETYLSNWPDVKPLCYEYYRYPITCHGIGSMLMFPRVAESGAIVWFLRSIITNRKWNCNDNGYVWTYDVGDVRPWIESHFKPSSETRCGRRVGSDTPLVTLGNGTTRGDWPWHTAIFLDNKEKTSRNYRCGGSLISATYVLTASHCVFEGPNLLNDRLSVKLGKYNLNDDENGSLDLRVSEVIPHESYDGANLRNDIALLRLPNDIIFSKFIQPVCLWEGDDLDKKNVFNKIGRVPGWGLNEENNYPNNLFMATIPIVEDILCYQSHATFYDNFLTNNTLCAGNPRGNGSGVCNGDSGGGLVLPVTQDDNEATWYLRGIVSVTVRRNNRNTCDPDYYAIYTDVAKYLDWINFQTTIFESTSA